MRFEFAEDENKEIQLSKESHKLIEMANGYTVTNPVNEEVAINFLTSTKRLIKEIKEYWSESIDQANKLHKTLTQKRKSMLDPCSDAESIISIKIKDYRNEILKQEAEARRKAEAERLQKEEEERDRLLKLAVEKEKENNPIEAVEKLAEAEAVYVPPTVEESKINNRVVTPNGQLGQSKDVKIAIMNEKALLDAIVRGVYPVQFIEFKMGEIKRWMKANGISEQNKNGLVVQPDINLRVKR